MEPGTPQPEPQAGTPRSADDLLLVSKCAPFRGISGAVLQQMVQAMEERKYAKYEVLLRQGDPGDALLVLLEGEAQVSVRDSVGKQLPIAKVRQGDVIGEMALITGEPRNADVVALTSVRTLVLPAHHFHLMVGANARLGMVFTNLLADRLGDAERDGLSEKVLDHYRIKRRIGIGATAVVYEAEDVNTDERLALKMMSHRLIFEMDAPKRFQREADLVQTLRHENILRLHGRFEAYKTCFLVMEYCDGQSLAELIAEKGWLDEDQVRAILGQLALGLAHVHSQGILHRDLKPSNVMVTKSGQVKLMDFGIAKSESGPFAELTVFGMIIGSLRYMPPEQLRGLPLKPSADLYAFGVIAYELLTGAAPVGGDDVGELMYGKANWKLPRRKKVRSDLSKDLYRVLKHSLSADPKKRKLSLKEVGKWAVPVHL